MSKFYAVLKGKKTGIFTSWPLCLQQVKGYRGAVFKSFKTKGEALLYLKGKETISVNVPTVDALAIYTDGACKGNRNVAKSNNPAGWGFAVVEEGTPTFQQWGPVVTDKGDPHYLGAEVLSNNTAELSARGEALQ